MSGVGQETEGREGERGEGEGESERERERERICRPTCLCTHGSIPACARTGFD